MESTAASLELPPVTPAFVDARATTGREETVAALQRAERFMRDHRYVEAVAALSSVHVPAVSAPDLALGVLLAEGWALMNAGSLESAERALERGRDLAEGATFSEIDRAEALFRLGACRLQLGKVSNAVSLLTVALGLADRGHIGGDFVRARAFEWRARCYVRQRDWEAAQLDAERALELAESIGEQRVTALALMQCSVIAERRGDPRIAVLYAERAHALAAATGDGRTTARLLNNLGGLRFLLGEPEKAVALLKEAFAQFLDMGNDTDAAQTVSSLAQVHLRCGAPLLADEHARHALAILDGRDDYVEERGNVHLVLGRALLAQGRPDEAMTEFAAAERLFARVDSASHLAAAWMAQGEAYARAGDHEASTTRYRRAAEALQDFNF